MKLAELQRYFAAAATTSRGPIAGLEEVFSGDDRLSASERLAIYNRAFFYRQLGALESVFGATKRLLGDVEFEKLGLAYLIRHPSQHPAIERVGRHFPAYLASLAQPPASPVVDVAALEWARLCALVAPNPAQLAERSALAGSAFPSCRVKFVPGLSWLEIEAQALQVLAGGEPSLEPGERCAVAVWRSAHSVTEQRLEDTEFQALCLADQGATMSEVCALFDTGNEPADAQRAFHVVSSWYSRRWLESLDGEGS